MKYVQWIVRWNWKTNPLQFEEETFEGEDAAQDAADYQAVLIQEPNVLSVSVKRHVVREDES